MTRLVIATITMLGWPVIVKLWRELDLSETAVGPALAATIP